LNNLQRINSTTAIAVSSSHYDKRTVKSLVFPEIKQVQR